MKLLSLSFLLSLLFAAAVSALRMQPAAALAAANADCDALCWRSFQPGVTTNEDAFAFFDHLGWTLDGRYCQQPDHCSVFGWRSPAPAQQKAGSIFMAGHLSVIAFQKPHSNLGEIMLLFGAPDRIDQYLSFDQFGEKFTMYRAYWREVDVQIRMDCPTTYAALLSVPTLSVTLAVDAYREEYTYGAKPPAISHSYRRVCRP